MSELPVSAEVMLYQGIRDILLAARIQARQTVNTTMVQAYWQVGRLIVEGEQGGEKRAEYGQRLLPVLAKRFSTEFGKGFSAPSLWNYRQFYLEFPILSTAWRELSWSHFRMLLRVKGRGNHQNTFVIARPQAVAIHRPQSAAMDCRATLAMT